MQADFMSKNEDSPMYLYFQVIPSPPEALSWLCTPVYAAQSIEPGILGAPLVSPNAFLDILFLFTRTYIVAIHI